MAGRAPWSFSRVLDSDHFGFNVSIDFVTIQKAISYKYILISQPSNFILYYIIWHAHYIPLLFSDFLTPLRLSVQQSV